MIREKIFMTSSVQFKNRKNWKEVKTEPQLIPFKNLFLIFIYLFIYFWSNNSSNGNNALLHYSFSHLKIIRQLSPLIYCNKLYNNNIHLGYRKYGMESSENNYIGCFEGPLINDAPKVTNRDSSQFLWIRIQYNIMVR